MSIFRNKKGRLKVITDSGKCYNYARWLYLMHKGSIPEGWVVHHRDFNKDNNAIENLVAIPEIMHRGIHYFKLRI